MPKIQITLTADDTTAAALGATIRAGVNGESRYDAFLADRADLTSATVGAYAHALVRLTYPSLPTKVTDADGKRTKYGNAHQMVAAGLRRALKRRDGAPAPKDKDYLALVLKAATEAITHNVEAAAIRDAILGLTDDFLLPAGDTYGDGSPVLQAV